MGKEVEFKILKGKTLLSVEQVDSDMIIFTVSEGEVYHMYHETQCCEDVYIEDVCGDINDLVASPVLFAYESTSCPDQEMPLPQEHESCTWTFYRIGTAKGDVVIRWYGGSNGCYSEEPIFELEGK